MNDIPTPRDNATIITVAVDGHALTWVGPPFGTPGHGELAGDGTPESRALVTAAHNLWADPINVDHPAWKHSQQTIGTTPLGVLATLLHLGAGYGIILEAPTATTTELLRTDRPSTQAPVEHLLLADVLRYAPEKGGTWANAFGDTRKNGARRREQDALNDAIQQQGVRAPVVVSEDGRLLDGRRRVQAAAELGLETLPVQWAQASPKA